MNSIDATSTHSATTAGHYEPAHARASIEALMRSLGEGLLFTSNTDARVQGTVLRLARIEEEGARVLFVASLDAESVDELRAMPQVVVIMQGRHRFVSLSGEAMVLRSCALAKELWRPGWLLQFPHGPADENLFFIELESPITEYSDLSMSASARTRETHRECVAA